VKRLLLSILVGLGTAAAAGHAQQLLTTAPVADRAGKAPSPRPSAEMLAQLSASLQQLAAQVSPAVVQIEAMGFGPARGDDRGALSMIVRQHWTGAGVIVDPDGYIVTNAHVVEGAQWVRVVLSTPPSTTPPASPEASFRTLNARVLGAERTIDLALLKVEATGLPTLAFDVRRTPQPGELVLAVGSPSGLRNSVTIGVISSSWRQPDPDNPMVYLQTDAAIGPGNSGGPLIDVTGAVVGLNTFIATTNGANAGLGFAIPARVVDFVYESLRKHGRVDHVEIGAVAQTITPTLALGLGLERDWGVVVADVVPFGPASAAGLQPGDIVLAIDGHAIPNLPWFGAALLQHPPEEILEIQVLRDERSLALRVDAGVVTDPIERLAEAADPMASYVERLGILGFGLDEGMRSLLPGLRAAGGVVVVAQAPGLGSLDVGLRPGDVIHTLNRTIVESVEQLDSELARFEKGDALVLRIERAGQFQFLAFEME
jgi:serine protease Do